MAIIEQSFIDQITVDEANNISVRRADVVLRDGEEIAKTYHRHVLAPGADLSNEDEKVQAVAAAIWQ
jgi:urease accessory protein UreE